MKPSPLTGGGPDAAENDAFELLSKVSDGPRSLVYRGRSLRDGMEVIVKEPAGETPRLVDINAYAREGEIAAHLVGAKGVVQLVGCFSPRHKPLIVYRDRGAVSLDRLFLGRRFTLMQKIAMAVKIADGMAQIHARGIVHGDINPANIVYDEKNAVIEIIDFGLARFVTGGASFAVRAGGPGGAEGTLAYLSPEQTGRLHGTVDRRSDLYSFGATLYEIFTGRPPFTVTEPLKLIHAHIALSPTEPARRVPEIPLVLSGIIMKLLEKSPQDRYQSARGVKADLQKCLHRMSDGRAVEPFILGLKDVPDDLNLQGRLYGRALETEALAGCLARSDVVGAQLVLFTGEAGSGKTALIREWFRPMHGRFRRLGEGRAGAGNGVQPFSPLIQAVRGLIDQMLCAADEEVSRFAEFCNAKLSSHAASLARLIPEMGAVWSAAGLQEPQSSEQKETPLAVVAIILREILAYAASPQQSPLILFLDDMQYCDLPTQRLLGELVRDERMNRVVCLLALRLAAGEKSHPLLQLAVVDGPYAASVTLVGMSELALPEIAEMIGDIFRLNKGDVFGLAEVLQQKCGGNPGAIRDLLKQCADRGMIAFDPAGSRWGWDIAQIRTMPFMDNVLDVMRNKLAHLSPGTGQVLLHASVWGLRFSTGPLAALTGRDGPGVGRALREALGAGLIREAGGDADSTVPLPAGTTGEGAEYQFSHEKIRDKLYHSLDDQGRRDIHTRITAMLMAQPEELSDGSRMERLAHHLNRSGVQGFDLEKMVRINHAAYVFARQKGAPGSAEYLQAAAALFQHDDLVLTESWQIAVALDLMGEAYREGKFDLAARYARLLVATDGPAATQANARAIRIAVAAREGRARETRKLAADWLRTFGHDGVTRESLAPDEVCRLVCMILAAGQGILPRRIAARLVALGLKSAPEQDAAGDRPVFELHRASLLVQRARTRAEGRSVAVAAMQAIRGSWGTEFQEEALLVYADGLPDATRGPTLGITAQLDDMLRAPLAAGMRSRVLLTFVAHCLYNGVAPDKLEKKLTRISDSQPGLADAAILIQLRDIMARLLGETVRVPAVPVPGPCVHLSYEEWLLALVGMIGSFLGGDHARATAYAATVRRGRAFGRGTVHGMFAAYYAGLLAAWSVMIEQPSFGARIPLLVRMTGDFLRRPARVAKLDTGMLPRFLLLRAALLATAGLAMAALRAFELAIEECEEGGGTHDLALAYELAGRFYASRGRGSLTLSCLKKAMRLNMVSGAMGKVRRLVEEFPALAGGQGGPAPATDELGAAGIDLMAMREALSAIVSESVAMRMLQKVLDTALRLLGAGRGVLILRKEKNRYAVEIEGGADGVMTPYYRAIPLDEYKNLPHNVINYVKRTRKTVILHKNLACDDGEAFPGDLAADPYLIANGVGSMLCYPVLLQGGHGAAHPHPHLVAILYLENRLLDSCFSADRVETLKIICLAAAGRLELSVRASTDGLTGLYNYEHFQTMLQREFLQAQRGPTPLAVLMIDIDRFKTFNDKWGHLAGDRVLKEVAHMVQMQCRKSDIVARYGGEEMAVILPGTTRPGAQLLAERIRRGIENLEVACDDQVLKITVSIGVAAMTVEMGDKESLVGAADKALYVSKSRGRNCVSTDEDKPPQDEEPTWSAE